MMTPAVSFTSQEAKEIDRLCQAMREESGWAELTLEHLLARWIRIVREAERGYGGILDEYANDLGLRDMIEDLIEDGPASALPKLRAALQPWDDRFFKATRAVDTPIFLPFDDEPPPAPWWFRVPKKLKFNPESQELAWNSWALYYPATAQPQAQSSAA